MAKLVTPNQSCHQYVVGIDFGHGETSAAICPLEWNKSAGQRETHITDLDMDSSARKKVIPSAICRAQGGLYIGEEAFEHMSDNQGIRVCFKQKPTDINGEAESLMIDYMKAIYRRIRECDDRLKDGNHIVYIARPSGWIEEEAKELYREMALKAGIPLAGLTSESRAAIFYAKSPAVSFANEISRGAIVFDLGSSTLDFTYLSDTDKPIDYGYDLGASIIDKTIFNAMIKSKEEIQEFLSKYPEYEGSLLYKARKFKETAYGRKEDSPTKESFDLDSIIQETEPAYEEYGDTSVKLKISKLGDLNDCIEEHANYLSNLKAALLDFKETKIKGKNLNGVFLTGGASRMNFIRPMIAETLSLPIDKVKIDNDNPSLTISRGIALLGATDAITSVLVQNLKGSLPQLIDENKILNPLIEKLGESISIAAWKQVESSCNYWIKFGKTTDRDELKEQVQKDIQKFQNGKLNRVVNDTFQSFVKDESEQIRKSMNEIISRYAPGREITMSNSLNLGNQQAITDSLKDMSSVIAAICDSISQIIADILWKALAAFLWGVFAIPYYVLKAIFTSDESKRKDKANDILDKKDEIVANVNVDIKRNLRGNSNFKNVVTKTLMDFFKEMIDSNLQKVIIPIE